MPLKLDVSCWSLSSTHHHTPIETKWSVILAKLTGAKEIGPLYFRGGSELRVLFKRLNFAWAGAERTFAPPSRSGSGSLLRTTRKEGDSC
jgi:hypothetical protein